MLLEVQTVLQNSVVFNGSTSSKSCDCLNDYVEITK